MSADDLQAVIARLRIRGKWSDGTVRDQLDLDAADLLSALSAPLAAQPAGDEPCGDEAQGKVCHLPRGHAGWHESKSHMWPQSTRPTSAAQAALVAQPPDAVVALLSEAESLLTIAAPDKPVYARMQTIIGRLIATVRSRAEQPAQEPKAWNRPHKQGDDYD